jgi:hypothetical protein
LSVGDGKTKNLFHDDKDKRRLGLSKMGTIPGGGFSRTPVA